MDDLRDLQIRRIDCAVDKSKAILARLEGMAETIDLILSDVDELQRSLHSIRLGLFREDTNPMVSLPAEAEALKEMISICPTESVIDRASLDARLAKVLAQQEAPDNG